MRRRKIWILAAVLLALVFIALAVVRTRIERRRGLPRHDAATRAADAAAGIPPVEQWTTAFHTLSGSELRELLDAIEERHPDLYANWSLAYLHARALIEDGDEDEATVKLEPFLEKGHPFRELALYQRAAIGEDEEASADRNALIFEFPSSQYRDEMIDEEVAWLAGQKGAAPLIAFTNRLAPAATTARRRELSSRIVEAQAGSDPSAALTRALALLKGGISDDAADRAARAIDKPELIARLSVDDVAMLGEAMQSHRHYDRATAILRVAISKRYDDELQFALGRSYFGAEQYDAAHGAYLRGANAAKTPARKALFLWHAARSVQLQGNDTSALRLMTAAIAVKGTFPSTTAALTQRIRTRIKLGQIAEAAADVALLRKIAPKERALFEGALAYAVGLLARGNDRGCIVTLDSIPRGVMKPGDRIEVAYWRARALEKSDPAAAVRGYLEVMRGTPSLHRQFAEKRLATPGLRAASTQQAALLAAQVKNLLAGDRVDLARRMETDRVHLLADRGAPALSQLTAIYRKSPEYRSVLELEAERLPAFPLEKPDPLDLLLAMSLFDDAAPGVTKRWALNPPRAALTRSRALNLGGASRDSIYAIEVMMRSVPDGFERALLPELVRQLLHPRYFAPHIEADASRHGADPALVLAIMREESRFDPRARSQAAARGLLQFIITTARDVGRDIGLVGLDPEDLYDPRIIISLGARYIGELGEQFEGNPHRIAAAYNAGPNQSALWTRLQPAPGDDYFLTAVNFDETKDYVRKVVGSYGEYLLER